MGTRKLFDDEDAYRDLPMLLKPLRRIKALRRWSDDDPLSSADRATGPADLPRAPSSAGYNPYFDLAPDDDRPVSRRHKGTSR